MNIQYPVSEILRSIEYINDPKKEIHETQQSNNGIFILRNFLKMEDKTEQPLILEKQIEENFKKKQIPPEAEKIIKEAESTIVKEAKEIETTEQPLILKHTEEPLILNNKEEQIKELNQIIKENEIKGNVEENSTNEEIEIIEQPFILKKQLEKEKEKEIEEFEKPKFESQSSVPFQIEEIIKINNVEDGEQDTTEEVLMLTEELNKKPSNEYSVEKQDISKLEVLEIKKLSEQVSILKKHNEILEKDLNKVFERIQNKTTEKELESRLELVYEQQKIIKDYESQIFNLKKQNINLEQKFNQSSSEITKNSNETSHLMSKEKYEEEVKMKSKILHEQQNILGDYHTQVLKLKEENRLLNKTIEINKSKLIDTEEAQKNSDSNKEDMVAKISYYQEDNLRLSNEVVTLSNKLENTKQQLKQFENNKAKLMQQLENFNNTISENNIIGTPFANNVKKAENITEAKEDKKPIVKSNLESPVSIKKIDNEETNLLTKKIFKS